MSVSTENFLKNVYLLNQEAASPVTSSLLAGRLAISAAAVTDMARKLGKLGLLDYRP
ncbi:MAG: metal-dependent transcriptional regulator, partial [Bacteroidota bacterium]